MREGDADVTLLTFNSGDLMPMCDNTDNRVQNFTPLAIMAVDKQLLFKGEHTPYADMQAVIDAVNSGTAVTVGGSKGDDIATYEAMIAELGFTEDQMPYITYDSTSDAITAVLGGHVDIVIAKPASAALRPSWPCPPSATPATWPTPPPCPRWATMRTLRSPCGAALWALPT